MARMTETNLAAIDERDWTNPCLEPTLDEIFADPMMDLVFRRDSLRRDHVEKLMRDQAARIVASGAWAVPCRCA